MTVEAGTVAGALSVADRSRVISESLRQTARLSRFADTKNVTRTSYSGGRSRRQDLLTPLLFVGLFLIPALAGILYYGVVASDRFITEASFALRPAIEGAEKATPDSVGTSLGVPRAMIIQDTLIVTDYIMSRPMIEAVDAQMPLRAMFSRPGIDVVSRFDPEKPFEKLQKYWADRVSVSVGASSGVVAVTVNAFSAEESLALTRAIVAESERMINAMSLRARTDSLEDSRRSLARAEERLSEVRAALRDLRNKEGVLDAQRAADANLQQISALRAQRMQMTLRRNTLLRDLAPEARSVQEVTAQIQRTDEMIVGLERATTSQTPQERRVLSEALGRFEALEVERRNAERYYQQAVAAAERARIVVERQLEFFSHVVEPVLPASAQAPRRLLAIFIVVMAAASLFLLALLGRRFLAG